MVRREQRETRTTGRKGVDGWLEENKERQEQQVEEAKADNEQVSVEPKVEETSSVGNVVV